MFFQVRAMVQLWYCVAGVGVAIMDAYVRPFRCGFASWQTRASVLNVGRGQGCCRDDLTGRFSADKTIVPYEHLTVFNTASFSSNQGLVRPDLPLSCWRSSGRPQQCLNDNITSTINFTTQQDCDGREQAQDGAGGVCCCCHSNISGMWDQRKSLLAAIEEFILTPWPVCLLRMGTGVC